VLFDQAGWKMFNLYTLLTNPTTKRASSFQFAQHPVGCHILVLEFETTWAAWTLVN
jgi:hypothetical protein